MAKQDDSTLPKWGRKMLWADDPVKVAMLVKGLLVLCGLLFVLDFILHRHGYSQVEQWYGFYAVSGFIAFSLIVIAAKNLRRLIARKEDYYGTYAIDSEKYPDDGLDIQSHPIADKREQES